MEFQRLILTEFAKIIFILDSTSLFRSEHIVNSFKFYLKNKVILFDFKDKDKILEEIKEKSGFIIGSKLFQHDTEFLRQLKKNCKICNFDLRDKFEDVPYKNKIEFFDCCSYVHGDENVPEDCVIQYTFIPNNLKIFNSTIPFSQKEKKIFYSGTKIKTRANVLELLSNINTKKEVKINGLTHETRMMWRYPEYVKRMDNSKFCLCPFGGGNDPGRRFIEALALGCIPITQEIEKKHNFIGDIKGWFNYIPYSSDFKDLEETIKYLETRPDDFIEEIAYNAKNTYEKYYKLDQNLCLPYSSFMIYFNKLNEKLHILE